MGPGRLQNQNTQFILINTLILVFFILDRVLKKLAWSGLVKKVFFVKFSLSTNPGIALSIPFKGIFFYFLLAVILYIVVFNLIKSYQKKHIIKFFSFGLIFVGALSNILDRLIHNVVIDYISLGSLTVFNLADVMILSGILIIAIQALKQKAPAK